MACSTRMRQLTMVPLLTKVHLFLIGSLVLGSICAMSLTTSHSSTTEWTCITAVYPAVKMALCSSSSSTASWASKTVTAGTGFTAEHSTNPVDTSSSSIPVTRMRTFSPGRQALHSVSSRYTLTTLTGTLLGMTMRLSPFFTDPASDFPIRIVPMSRYLSMMGILNGALGSLSCGCIWSRYSKKLGPSYQGHISLLTLSLMLYPISPEQGMYCTSVLTLYPQLARKGEVLVRISS
mmetsp:Transcript_6752/g.23573  ORF Transcript_6752/g.23573 Transcript_6752/m.23573 type:complete len:235 (-) Transcript_6752:932-1636(-)